MIRWILGALACMTIFLFTNAGVSNDEFFLIPSKNLRFVNQTDQKNLNLHRYVLSFESRLNCQDPECRKFSGTSTSNSEVSGTPESFQTLATRVPRMPNSGSLRLTFKVDGLCKNQSHCAVTVSYEDFIKASEPVILAFDYDEAGSNEAKTKRQAATSASFAEIEKEMGAKPVHGNTNGEMITSTSTPSDPLKKLADDYRENRRHGQPMTYSEKSLAQLNLSPSLCGKGLQQKIEKCETYVCIAPVEPGKVAKASDFIVHGKNGAGNCAISVPGGKRFFVPADELVYFYEAYGATYAHFSVEFLTGAVQDRGPASKEETSPRKVQSTFSLDKAACVLNFEYQKNTAVRVAVDDTSPTTCRDKKVDLLYQLSLRHLTTEYQPTSLGE